MADTKHDKQHILALVELIMSLFFIIEMALPFYDNI